MRVCRERYQNNGSIIMVRLKKMQLCLWDVPLSQIFYHFVKIYFGPLIKTTLELYLESHFQ